MSHPAPGALMKRVQLAPTRAPRVTNARALALLDVLIGMAIFALIAIIAVVSMGQFKNRAYVTSVIEDAKTLGTSVEAVASDGSDYVAPVVNATDPTKFTLGDGKVVQLTKGDTMLKYKAVAATASTAAGFTLCMVHNSGTAATPTYDAYAVYDSTAGGIVPGSKGAGAPPAALVPCQ